MEYKLYLCFSGAFANLRKATVIIMSVRMEQLGSHWTDFHKILRMSIFQKSVEKIQVPFTSDKKKPVLYTMGNIHF